MPMLDPLCDLVDIWCYYNYAEGTPWWLQTSSSVASRNVNRQTLRTCSNVTYTHCFSIHQSPFRVFRGLFPLLRRCNNLYVAIEPTALSTFVTYDVIHVPHLPLRIRLSFYAQRGRAVEQSPQIGLQYRINNKAAIVLQRKSYSKLIAAFRIVVFFEEIAER